MALVSRNKGSGEMGALLEGGRKASVGGERARELYLALPADVRKRLDKGKSVQLNVGTETVGNAARIVSLEV